MPAALGNVQVRLIDWFFYAQERKSLESLAISGTPQYRSARVLPRVPLDRSVCASAAAALADFLSREGHASRRVFHTRPLLDRIMAR
jgi:hypothetical protein